MRAGYCNTESVQSNSKGVFRDVSSEGAQCMKLGAGRLGRAEAGLLFGTLLASLFMGTPMLRDPVFGVPGLKAGNLLGLLLLFAWAAKGGRVLRFRDRLEFAATWVLFLYIVVFSVEVARSLFQLDVLSSRYGEEFSPSGTTFLLSYWLRPVLYVIPFLYLLHHVRSKEKIDQVARLVVLAFAIFSAYVLTLSVGVVLSGELNRAELLNVFLERLGYHYNTVGSLLVPGVLLALGYAMSKGRLWYVPMALITAALLTTQSRGAMLGVAAGALLLLYLRRELGLGLGVMIATVIGLIAFFSGPLLELLSLGAGEGVDQVSSGRIEAIWLPLLSELIENPLRLAIGYGRYGLILSDSAASSSFFLSTHAHNAYLDLLVDSGMIVLVPFLIFLAACIRKSWLLARRGADPIFSAILCAIVSYLIACVSERQFFPAVDNMMLFPMIALMVNIYRSELALKVRGARINWEIK